MREHNNIINHSKICPAETNETRQADNPPDVPVIETSEFKKLAMRFPININNSFNRLPGFEIQKGKKIADPQRGEIDVVELRPVGKKPLVPFTEISIGGGRSIGGGTSRESLRRAKRKAKINGIANGNGKQSSS